MSREPVAQLRRIALALPEATEKLSHGEASFFCRKQFLMMDAPPRRRPPGVLGRGATGRAGGARRERPRAVLSAAVRRPPRVGGHAHRPRPGLGRGGRGGAGRLPAGRAEATGGAARLSGHDGRVALDDTPALPASARPLDRDELELVDRARATIDAATDAGPGEDGVHTMGAAVPGHRRPGDGRSRVARCQSTSTRRRSAQSAVSQPPFAAPKRWLPHRRSGDHQGQR